MTYVSKNWKTLITLLVAVVLYVAWSTSPVVALSYDPMLPKPWVSVSEIPLGDEGGWNDTDGTGETGGTGLDRTLSSVGFYLSKYFILYFVPKAVEQNKPVDYDGSNEYHNTNPSRGTSSN
jgi:hypothetical protein